MLREACNCTKGKTSPWVFFIFLKLFNPEDTGRKLNVFKTFRRSPGRLLNVLCTFNLGPVYTGKCYQITQCVSNNLSMF